MDREIILAALACLLCGPALVLSGWLRWPVATRRDPRAPGLELERAAWRRLWQPLVPAALVFAFLIGWAAQEPEDAEAGGVLVFLVAAVFAVIVVRAVIRAVRATRFPDHAPVAMTVGLVRPRVVVAPALADHLDARALRAALAHEEAHVRHLDPLRVWLAQLATDLQWPAPAARQRFVAWREALELARDAEACERVDGSDLAAALIAVAQLARAPLGRATVGLVPDRAGAAFADRIHRLLDGPEASAPAQRSLRPWLAFAAGLAVAAVAGAVYGEAIVNLLPGL